MSRPMAVHFVCTGNICRSPMGEFVARAALTRAGLDVAVSSSGVSNEESGNPIDPRAREVLRAHGYDANRHRARQTTAAMLADADLVLAAEPHHLARLRRLAPEHAGLHLICDFDPDAAPGAGLPDPWYGPPSGFEDTLAAIEACLPGIIGWVRNHREPQR